MLSAKPDVLKQSPQPATGWSVAGALTAAATASICCLGPLVLVALGVGGALAGSLVALEPFRPVFILITAALLTFAFHRGYRTPEAVACAPDDACTLPRATRINRIALWLLTPIILLLLILPYLVPHLLGTQPPPAAVGAGAGAGLEQVTLQIEGMTCPTCTISVQRALLRLDGVTAAYVTYDPPQAVVTYDPLAVSATELMKTTMDVGFPSRLEQDRSE
jgi:mercuric ion transport protein